MPPPSGSTPTLLLPYPVPNDPVDVPRDIKALADKLDSSLGGGGSGGGGVLKAAPVLDVGVTGQVRAGRQLALADFTDLGLSAPAGLWNLSNLTDASGNGRSLSNRNAVTFAAGINGTAATAAQFRGASGTPANDPALYIADTGAADPFRIQTGSWGCWFRTAKRATLQYILTKLNTAAAPGGRSYNIYTDATSNTAVARADTDGANANLWQATGATDVCDDRWHFVVATFDGSPLRLYVDGVLEAVGMPFGSPGGTIFGSNAPLNIGAWGADGSVAAGNGPHFGRVDEAFITADVLSEDQIRVLYAARIPHALGTVPRSATLTVNRRRKGAALAPADFTTTPLRLYNLGGAGINYDTDLGSNGVPLTAQGGATSYVSGADGVPGAYSFPGNASFSATDAGLPAALAARSYGCWFKTLQTTPSQTVLAWGTVNTGDSRVGVATGGTVFSTSGADNIGVTPPTPFVADGQWHQVIVTEDNAAADGVRRKLYLDGRLVGISTVMNSTVLVGANSFRVGATSTGTNPITGQIDGAFVTGYALDAAEIARLYAKNSQGLGASPKNAGDHVERMDATAVYFIGDTLESQHQIDLGVAS
jgi:hypothetical protein